MAPACKLPKIAKKIGSAKVVEVSPRETDLSHTADILLLGTSAIILPQLLAAIKALLKEQSAEVVSDNDLPATNTNL